MTLESKMLYAEQWDRYCANHALPEGTYERYGLTWYCDDEAARLDADDEGWPEFLMDELPNLPWRTQRAIYAVMAGLDEQPVQGRIPVELASAVEALLCEEVLERYEEAQR